MISQFILSQIESLIPLLLFPHVLPYPAASVNGRFGCCSVFINSHHIARGISDVSRRIAFGRSGNNLRYSVAHGVVSEINTRLGPKHGAHFAFWSPCYGQSFICPAEALALRGVAIHLALMFTKLHYFECLP